MKLKRLLRAIWLSMKVPFWTFFWISFTASVSAIVYAFWTYPLYASITLLVIALTLQIVSKYNERF